MRRWTLGWAAIAAVSLVLGAQPASPALGPTVAARHCANPKQRPFHECLDPSSVEGATLTGNVPQGSGVNPGTGQKFAFTVDAPPTCPLQGHVGMPPCSKIDWVLLYGASYADWGARTWSELDVKPTSGCKGNDHTCDFTVDYQRGAPHNLLTIGTVLRVTAVVEIDGFGCGTAACSFGPLAPHGGGGWLDWVLRLGGSAEPSLTVAVTTSKSNPSVGDAFDASVKVTAVNGPVDDIALGQGLALGSTAASVTKTPPGLSGFSLASGGSKTFAFGLKAEKSGTLSLQASARGKSSSGTAVQGSGSAKVKIGGSQLVVTVTPRPGTLRLELNGDSLKPQTVSVAVAVKNTGTTAVLGARLQDKLTAGYVHFKPTVSEVPVKPDGLPSPQDLGELAPGKTATGIYKVTVVGDGDYSLDALVIGADRSGNRITGTGSGEIDITAPILVASISMGSGESRPDSHGLIVSGTPFTVDVKLENLSYVHEIAVLPARAGLSGNAFGGQIVEAGTPIDKPGLKTPMPEPEFLDLPPRKPLAAEAVVYTAESQGALPSGGVPSKGGTRATVVIPTPKAVYVNDDGTQGKVLAAQDISVDGDTTFPVGIDDRDLSAPPPPGSWTNIFPGLAYFESGMVIGACNFFAGMVHAIPNLPSLIGQGLVATGNALYSYARFEAELWSSLKDDPVAMAAFTNFATAQLYLVYKHVEGFANSDFKKQIDAALVAYFSKLDSEWNSGNWGAAVEQLGEVTGEQVAPIAGGELASWLVKGMAPGLLARSKPVLQAFASSKNKLFTAFGEQLTAKFPKLARALDAISALRDAPAGFEYTDTQIRQLYGLTQREVEWLRDFAKAQDLVIVVRSRAVESIAWLDKGAVLKPEAIKLKNVSLYDWEYLGYQESDIGRVVISQHELPSVTAIEAEMRANGITEGGADWNAILKRRAQRLAEFSDPLGSGTVKDMVAAAKEGKMTMHWNLADNDVAEDAIAVKPSTYEFRLADENGNAIPKSKLDSYKGTMVPEYYVNGQWRSVTGDVDFLQITKANGTPLSDAERASIYAEIAKGPVGLLHPETATWTLKNAFDFEKKVNEFVRAGTCLQFAPDGLARAVKFAAAKFEDKLRYLIEWDGGVAIPQGAVAPS